MLLYSRCASSPRVSFADRAVLLVRDLGPAIDERQVRSDHVGTEVAIVEDAVGEVLALIEPIDNGIVEPLLERYPEVVDVVRRCLLLQHRVGNKRGSDALEVQSVRLGELQPVSLVQLRDDLRQRLFGWLLSATHPVGDCPHLAHVTRERHRSLVRHLVTKVGQFHLAAEVEA